jgi:hypothetical protein
VFPCDKDATFGKRETTILSFHTTEESVSTPSQITSTIGQAASEVKIVGGNEVSIT